MVAFIPVNPMSQKIASMVLAGIASLAFSFPALAAEEVLESGDIKVVVDSAGGGIRMDAGGRTVVENLRCGGGGTFVRAEWLMLTEPLGATRALSLSYSNNRSVLLALFPGRPFLCIRQQITNPGEADADISSEQVAEGTLVLGGTADQWKSFGTAGISALDKNSGSYMYQAVVNPSNDNGLVGGWLSSDRGSGVLFTPVIQGRVGVRAVTEYGRLRLKPKSSERGEWLALGWFGDARLGLEAYADAVAACNGIKLPAQPTGYCTWYSAPFGGAGDEKHTAELAAFAGQELKPYGFGFVQIDDKWQSGARRIGPAKNFTGVPPDGPYPSGMKAAAASIAAHGLMPGLWFMPFAGDHQDSFYKDRAGWFVKTADGKPFETPWGGTSLDLSQAAVQDHVRGLVRMIVNDWGFRYLKMDGLYTGLGVAQVYVHGSYREDGFGKQVFADPYQTPVEIFRKALGMIRQEAGTSTYLLGCCIPQNLRSMGASIGLVDAMRIGADNNAEWKSAGEEGAIVGPIHGTRRWFLHRRVWHNDPDPIYVRPSLSIDQARTLATWTAMSGQLNTHSEWTPGLPPERLQILKQTMPPHGLAARPVDVFEYEPARVWVLQDPDTTPARVVVALYNWSAKPVDLVVPAVKLGLDPARAYDGWEFWSNKQVPGVQGDLKVNLPASSCKVLALRPRGNFPMIVSTSRHVLQGVVELSHECWTPETKRLGATLATVGKDACEIRILLPDEGKGWADGQVVLGEPDAAAGVRASLTRDGAVIRLRIESPESREVAWSLQW